MDYTLRGISINVERSWILYDVANSAYILLAVSLLPIYFNELASNAGLTSAEYLGYWSLAATFATGLMFLVGPLLGSMSDRKGWRKPIFTGTVVVGVLTCFVMGIPKWWLVFLILFVISKIAFNSTIVVSDSMLNDVTTHERMNKVSSMAYAFGYIGSCIPFLFCLVFIMFSDMMSESAPLTFETAVALGLTITAVWWAVLSLPLLKNYRQIHHNEVDEVDVKGKFTMFVETFRSLKARPDISIFLLAYFLYIDGVFTVMDLSVSFGSALGLGSIGMLVALLMIQVIAFPSTLMMNKLAEKVGEEKVICIGIVGYIVVALFSLFLVNLVQFYILAVLVGMFQGTIQALSRSYFAKLIPKEKTGEMFGVMDVFGKGATMFGTLCVSFVTLATGEVRSLGLILIALFILGLILFIKSVKIRNATAQAGGE